MKAKEGAIELAKGKYTGILKNVIETEHFIFSNTNYSACDCNDSLHNHKNPHICLLYQGTDIESREDLVPYKRTAGDIFYYRAGENHKMIRTLEDSKNINIELKENVLVNLNLSVGLNFNFERTKPNVRLLALNILEELLTNDDDSSKSLELLAIQLIELTDDAHVDFRPSWVGKLENYLHDNWNCEFSLIQLGVAIGIHPITISKNFRKNFSCTYGQYRRMLKVYHSIPLIKNENMSLTEVALHCGFSDQSHFIKNFKKFSGFLPKKFQRI